MVERGLNFAIFFDNHDLASILRYLRESFFKGVYYSKVFSTVLTKFGNIELKFCGVASKISAFSNCKLRFYCSRKDFDLKFVLSILNKYTLLFFGSK